MRLLLLLCVPHPAARDYSASWLPPPLMPGVLSGGEDRDRLEGALRYERQHQSWPLPFPHSILEPRAGAWREGQGEPVQGESPACRGSVWVLCPLSMPRALAFTEPSYPETVSRDSPNRHRTSTQHWGPCVSVVTKPPGPSSPVLFQLHFYGTKECSSREGHRHHLV